MTYGRHRADQVYARVLRDSRREFLRQCGLTRFGLRVEAIARLPRAEWRGQQLFTIRCAGPFGKGPHKVNVPESLLWNLISLEHFLCPYHR